MQLFAGVVGGFQPLAVFEKNSIIVFDWVQSTPLRTFQKIMWQRVLLGFHCPFLPTNSKMKEKKNSCRTAILVASHRNLCKSQNVLYLKPVKANCVRPVCVKSIIWCTNANSSDTYLLYWKFMIILHQLNIQLYLSNS